MLLCCVLIFCGGHRRVMFQGTSQMVFQVPDSDTQLIGDYQKLLRESLFSDFVIKIGAREIKVHRAILASRSSVFAAMLAHDTEEAKNVRLDFWNSSVAKDVKTLKRLEC